MYLLDANVFIEAKNRYYAFDLAPGFRHWLEADSATVEIANIDEVGTERKRGNDDLAQWAKARPQVFRTLDAATNAKLTDLSTWANSGQFTPAAVSEFLGVADYFLVAYAAAYGRTVVTHEVFEANAKGRVLIPNACQALGVQYCTTFTTLRSRGVQLALA